MRLPHQPNQSNQPNECVHELLPHIINASMKYCPIQSMRPRISAPFNWCVYELVSCLIDASMHYYPNFFQCVLWISALSNLCTTTYLYNSGTSFASMHPISNFLNYITLEINSNGVLLNQTRSYHPVIIRLVISLKLDVRGDRCWYINAFVMH
jgi:hypothetical protein